MPPKFPSVANQLFNQQSFPEPITSNLTTPVTSPHQSTSDNPPPNNFPDLESETAIDLDTPAEELADAAETETVLSCHKISDSLQEDPIHEGYVFQPGTESCEVCPAEDGLALIDEPRSHHDHQRFMLEVLMSRQDLLQRPQSSHPEELAQVASAGKRARAEVPIKDLNAEERRLFDTAKEALKPILRKHLNPDQVLKSRWVLIWKSVANDGDKTSARKAKARLVVLGYQDPRLADVNRDA